MKPKLIPLTQNQFAIVDDHWFDYLNQWKWCATWNEGGQCFYAIRHEGSRINQKKILMHRVVANTPDDMICDHIHHNTLDNREKELRNVTPSQSRMNVKVSKRNKLGVKGVWKHKDRECYIAQHVFQGKMVLNKTFPTMQEALDARIKSEIEYCGEFSYNEA